MVANRAVVAVKMIVFTIFDAGKRRTEWKRRINCGEFWCSAGITPIYVRIVAPS